MSIYQIEQELEVPVTKIQDGPFLLRYAYARSRDSRSNNEKGQDYITWRVDSEKLVFALCDGVSKSFLGEVGARILGNMLVGWLWEVGIDEHQTKDDKPQQLKSFLNSKVESAGNIFEQVNLRNINNEFVKDALNTRRIQTGSQSNFVCGVIEMPGEKYGAGNIELFWLGDAKLKIFNNIDDLTHLLQAKWNSKAGWSSKDGVVGKIQHYQGRLEDIDSIIAYSDGLDQISGILSPNLHSVDLDRTILEQNETPKSDDISFLEISIGIPILPEPPVSPETQKKPAVALVVGLVMVVIAFSVWYLLQEILLPPGPSEGSVTTYQTVTIQSLDPSMAEGITKVDVAEESTPIIPTPVIKVFTTQEVRIVTKDFNFLLAKGCNDISSLRRFDTASVQLRINGSFLVKAYTTNDCYGEPLLFIYEWNTDKQLLDGVQSLYVHELLFK
jgi:hypothetical protein